MMVDRSIPYIKKMVDRSIPSMMMVDKKISSYTFRVLEESPYRVKWLQSCVSELNGENFSIGGRTKDPHIFLLLVQIGKCGGFWFCRQSFAERNFRCDLFHPYDLSVKLTYVIYIKKQFCALVIIK